MRKTIIAIVGESGAGKSTLAKRLEEEKGYNVIQSYTTRKPRKENEYGHEYAGAIDYQIHKGHNQVVASTFFDNNLYWATKDQFKGDIVNVYIVDVEGLRELEENMGDWDILKIYIRVGEEVSFERIYKRSEGGEFKRVKSLRRVENDRKSFQVVKCDYSINGERGIETVYKNLLEIIEAEIQG